MRPINFSMFRALTPRTRKAVLVGGACASLYVFDKYFYYSTLQRNLYTFYTCAIIAADYKWNFEAKNAHGIDALHSRTARRILDMCKANGGLYIKFGQQMASVPVLPPQYLKELKQLYDDAPFVDYSAVESIFQSEFGTSPSEIYETFDKNPIASASIAQVHKATLKDGTEVAVKIQKPEIAKQIKWDMMAYSVLTIAFELLFDLPLYWSSAYIEKHLREEVDFLNEIKNAERCQEEMEEIPEFKRYVYVPKVYHEFSTRTVMTAEWIQGVPLSNQSAIREMGISVSQVMRLVVNVFADQIFRVGFVHCDPHPGNILIRRNPKTNDPQVVLLDHGLYATCSPKFKHEYALFWKSLFSLDASQSTQIAEGWGIKDTQMFASATLARPWRAGKPIHVAKVTAGDIYEGQLAAKKKLSEFLSDTDRLPKELIFVGRNLNMGSPVNRINLMANYAVQSLGNNWSLVYTDTEKSRSFARRLADYLLGKLNYLTFRTTLLAVSLSFHVTQLYHSVRHWFGGAKGAGFEGVMDDHMKQALQEAFPGMVFDDGVFDG